jgi:hypothetical protein
MTDRPYVDLHEAVRVVMRLMRDGERLAALITDDWIVLGFREWNAANNPANDGSLTQQFGADWRMVRPRAFAAYWRAIGVLEKVLASGRVRGTGVPGAERQAGRRPINREEWGLRRLDIRRGLLTTSAGREPEPPILDVLLSVDDLKREAASALVQIEREAKGEPNLESILREAMREAPKLTQKRAFEIARKAGAKEPRAIIRDLLKTLGGSDIPGPKGPRSNRAAPSA